jgi:hypothetical protein
MRLIDYFDRGAELHPERHCPVGKVLRKILREPCWAGGERKI